MNSKKLAKIKEICEQNDMANADAIAAIKEVLEIDNYPNVSKLSNGEAFTFKGIKFVKIGEEQGGYLCVAAEVLFDSIFDENNNNYSKSEIKNKLNQLAKKLGEENFNDFTMDLTSDDGNTEYGTYTCKIGLLSCDLRRKYWKILPRYERYTWTCTPWYIDETKKTGLAVRVVRSDGTLYRSDARSSIGVAPACIFKKI